MNWILPFVCAFFTGILSSWGVGGGTLLLLIMTLFLGVDQRLAQGINLLFFLPTAGVALFFHQKNGFLDKKTVKQTVPWAVVTALVGAWVATAVDVELLRRPFGLFLLFAGGAMLWQSFFGKKQLEE